MLSALSKKAVGIGLKVVDNQYVSRLLVKNGECFGALAFDQDSGERIAFLADAVILATGGHTRVWRRTSSRRDENNGDGIFLAIQAGCSVADMELVQFHPTGMVAPEEVAGTLVSEAVRGEGGRLTNSQGERFMVRYDPARMELSTRDRVAFANYTEVLEGRGGPNGGVFLDISHRGKDFILSRLPRMYRQFIEYQRVDIAQGPMEVAQTAHYSMGGVVVDPETHSTAVPGLYAAGEVTFGLHGANLLGGNSLVETIVFGKRAGEAAAEFSRSREVQLRSRNVIAEASDDLEGFIHGGSEIVRPVQRALRDAMWENCGVVRNERGMKEGLNKVAELRAMLPEVDVRPTAEGFGDLAHVLDLRASLLTAEATLLGALHRKESRGCHIRQDFPEQAPQFKVNFHIKQGSGGDLEISARPVAEVPDYLEEWAGSDAEVDMEGKLVE